MPAADQDCIAFGPFSISRSERILRRGDSIVHLPPKAVDTLLALAVEPGRVIEKATLLERVWPDTFVEEGGLARNISLLRKILGANADGRQFIETIPRRGYRLAAEPTIPSEERLISRSLAVLPLRYLSPETGTQYFADGMTDVLIGSLMRIERLQVAPRTAVMRLRDLSASVREVARKLHVEYVVEGSVLLSEDRVRVEASLLRGDDGFLLWCATYERDVIDVLALQRDLAMEIVREIRVKLTKPQASRLRVRHDVLPEAYQHYLLGRFHWNQRTRESLWKALRCFQQAVDLDSNFAPAYAGLAESYVLLGNVGYDVMPPHASMPTAREVAQQALALDPDLADAYAVLGAVQLLYDWDSEKAEGYLQQARLLNPGCAAAHHWAGELALARARPEEAAESFAKGAEIDEYSIPCNLGLGWAYYFSRRYERAFEQFGSLLGRVPSLPMALYGLGLSCYHLRDFEKGSEVLRQAKASSGGEPASLMLLAATAALLGDRESAHAYRMQMQEMSHHTYVPPVYFAFIHAMNNDLDDAFDWLERAFDERSSYLTLLRVQPALHNLRADPRYFQLVRRVGI